MSYNLNGTKQVPTNKLLSQEMTRKQKAVNFIKESGWGRFFFETEGKSVETIDAAVNAVSLLNALILTIPYGIIGVFTPEFFDNLEIAINSCPEGSHLAQFDTPKYVNMFRRYIYGTLVSSICVLLICS